MTSAAPASNAPSTPQLNAQLNDHGRVDWVDYKARLDRTPPEAFAQALLDRAGDAEIFLVYSADYTTHRQRCPALYNALAAARTPEVLTQPTDVYEPASVVAFTPRPAGS